MSVVDDKDFHELKNKLSDRIIDKERKIDELDRNIKELMECFEEIKGKLLNPHEKQKILNGNTIRACVLAILLLVSSVKLDAHLIEKIEKILEVIIK